MAERYLIATGDVGTAANWDGGVALPDVGDDCYANGFTGTFTSSRTAASWRTTAGGVAAGGGGFACSIAGVTIGGNLISGTTTVLAISNATGTVTLTGNTTGSATTGLGAFTKNGAGLLSVIGDITAGSVTSANGGTLSAGSAIVTGNLLGASGGTVGAIGISGTSVLDVTGSVTGGSTSANYGIRVLSGAPIITVMGSVTGGSAGDGIQIPAAATPTIVVNGNCYGGTGSSSNCGISNNTGTVTVNGNAVGGTSSATNAYGVENISTGTVAVTGYAIGAPSGGSSAGVYGFLAATTTVADVRTSATGVAGIAGKVFLSSLTTGTLQGVNASLTMKTFYPTDFAGLLPAAANVRSGTIYNLTLSTGTLAVPAVGSVLNGVAVDAGTGTYVVVATANVRSGTTFGAASALTGTLAVPTAANVLNGVSVDAGTGTYVVVTTANVRSGTTFGAASASTGTLAVPVAANVLNGVSVDAGTGTYVTVSINDVESGVTFGAASALTGVFVKPTAAQVLSAVGFGANSTEFTGTVVLPAVGDVESGVTFGPSSGLTGTLIVTQNLLANVSRIGGVTLIPVVGETISQSITVYGTDGTTAVNLSGKTLTIIFETMTGVDVSAVLNADITVSGASNNVVTFAYPSAVTATERTLRFSLRDAAAPLTMYLQGICSVTMAPQVDPP